MPDEPYDLCVAINCCPPPPRDIDIWMPEMEQLEVPSAWWDAEADRSLLIGVFKHGTGGAGRRLGLCACVRGRDLPLWGCGLTCGAAVSQGMRCTARCAPTPACASWTAPGALMTEPSMPSSTLLTLTLVMGERLHPPVTLLNAGWVMGNTFIMHS